MIGFHLQEAIPGWTDAAALLPAGTPWKAVEDYFILRDAKQANPGLLTIYRRVADGQQDPSLDYQTNRQKARDFFGSCLDGTWRQQGVWRWVDCVEEWNEYQPLLGTPETQAKWLSWIKAVNDVWDELQADHYNELGYGRPCGRIRLVCCNTAVGNDIGLEHARIVKAHGNIMSYHGYTKFAYGVRDSLDWRYYTGRWASMDQQWRAAGVTVDWLCTEAGPFWNVFEGWRHEKVLSGNRQRYIDECVKYTIDNATQFNRRYGHRFLGSTLFTVMRSGWEWYNHNGDDMLTIARAVADYSPQPPPPQPGDWYAQAWSASVAEQIARGIPMNPNAGLQRRIHDDGFTVVHREIPFTDYILQAGEDPTGVKPRRVYRWRSGDAIDYFLEP
eukprot:GHVO01031040.1.p1 GENE.GHVO01031040.1~~GHVO01031040.1.p1  ORF type:complete len:387 (-),score=13.85 GHVO01031040.1:495-1655(-)